ncbi:MAG: lytic transglycosylase domain-containing protein [Pseudolabrys sp.]
MEFSGENILILLMVGLVAGLLPGAIVERKGVRLIRDITIGIGAVFVAGLLTLAWRDATTFNLWPSNPAENVSTDLGPRYEPVVLPLAPLRPLLKPIVYRSREEICDVLAAATRNNDLPAHFFIRLLYQESNFRLGAISSAGALGIAQFTPETATDRGLDNPFDPLQAIPASARLLRDLYQKFGNLGLAAAAYNAGPRRISDWLANKGQLPQETQDYVKVITGWPPETWIVAQAGSPAVRLPRAAPCQEAVGLLAWNGPDEIPLPPRNPRMPDVAGLAAVEAQSTKPRTEVAHDKSDTTKQVQDAKTTDRAGQQKPEKLPRSVNGQ